MHVIETERLSLRQLAAEDAEFIYLLVNDPEWLRFIGDRGVRTLEDARTYIRKGPQDSYARHGFGLYLTSLKDSATPIGICGLVKRETLPDADLGFAFMPQFRGRGYAWESARAVLTHASHDCGLRRLLAITAPDNLGSIRVLEKLGFAFERCLRHGDETHEVRLYARDLAESVQGSRQ